MATTILILAGLSLVHFVLDAIIGPAQRAVVRFEAFALRDQLREVYHVGGVDRNTFLFLHNSINSTIYLIPMITPSFLWEVHRMINADQKLRQRIDERSASMKSASPEIQKIASSAADLVYRSLCLNSLGLVIYIIPAVGAVAMAQWGYRTIGSLLALSEREIQRGFPVSHGLAPTTR